MRILGVIESFDERRGDGQLRSDEGTLFYLHCTAIADGSRVIAPGVRVAAERRVGHLGRDEAAGVTSIS
jgi:hypothetical protein